MIGGRTIRPIAGLKEGPAETAEQAVTAEVAWQSAEPQRARAKTVLGTGPVSNAATFSENDNSNVSSEPNHIA